jgi:hypothetical protein
MQHIIECHIFSLLWTSMWDGKGLIVFSHFYLSINHFQSMSYSYKKMVVQKIQQYSNSYHC